MDFIPGGMNGASRCHGHPSAEVDRSGRMPVIAAIVPCGKGLALCRGFAQWTDCTL